MAYRFRARNPALNYASNSDRESSDTDSGASDPDYARTRPRRTSAAGASTSRRITENLENDQRRRPVGRPAGRRRGKRSRRANRGPGASSSQAGPVERTILSWLIDHGILAEDEELYALKGREENDDSKTKRLVRGGGKARRNGVWCACCDVIMSTAEFESHAGSNLGRPYSNIFVARTDYSLLQCQAVAWDTPLEREKRGFNQVVPRNGAADHNDDACLVCADGGDLVCCERCPSTFHSHCMGMGRIPQGDWWCSYCVCRHCEAINGHLETCFQCDKKYHWQCFLQRQHLDLNRTVSTSLCSTSCTEVYEKLQGLVGQKQELEEGLSWSLIRQMEPEDKHYHDEYTRTECNSKIALAWELLNDCFRRNNDRFTRINVLQSVVYNSGSNLTRINFRGFYTAVLERKDEILTAATIRVHGTELAEMPYIATRHQHRKKGFSKILFSLIESVLWMLQVQHLVIPAVPDVADMWEEKYGFVPMDNRVTEKLTRFNALMFPATIRLQKTYVLPPDSPFPSAAMDVDDDHAELPLLDLNQEPPTPREDELARPVPLP